MKKYIILFVVLSLALLSWGQENVGINTLNPDPNSALDIQADDKGILIPRLSNIERLAMTASLGVLQHGLMVFDLDDNLFYYWSGATWLPFPVIQNLSLSGDTLFLSGGGNVILPNLVDTDDQNLQLNGTVLSIDDGNSVDLAILQDGIGTDSQSLQLNGDTLSISNGNSVVLSDNVDDADADPSNEIQSLSYDSIAGTLTISGGNSVTLPIDTGGTDDQNLTFATVVNDTLTIGIENGDSVSVQLPSLNPFLELSNDTLFLRPTNSFVILPLKKEWRFYTNDGF